MIENLQDLDETTATQLKQLLLATLTALNRGRSEPKALHDEMDGGSTEDNTVCVNAMLRRVSTPKHPLSPALSTFK